MTLAGGMLAAGLTYRRKERSTCDSAPKGKNAAFVFIKPHANTKETRRLVHTTLENRGLRITKEGELTAETIDKDMLIDQHYYAIASKATLLKPKELPIPKDKFQKEFGLSWEDALQKGLVFNAMDACEYLKIDAAGLDKAWAPAKKVKFGGGFYCGLVEVPGKTPIYVFNGFFMQMRSAFVKPGTSIHYYVVEFEPSTLSWSDFRGKVLGPTDPKDAPSDSLRGKILSDWKSLGLAAVPNVGENGVHASASPFEGLAERMNWLKIPLEKDEFGVQLLKAGVPASTIKAWSVDPQVKGKSLFDQLEDSDADVCVKKAVELAK